jgi:hypothetical protein
MAAVTSRPVHARVRQESKWVNTGRDFRLNIVKVDVADEHWARYADEDEEDQIELAGGSGFGPLCTLCTKPFHLSGARHHGVACLPSRA